MFGGKLCVPVSTLAMWGAKPICGSLGCPFWTLLALGAKPDLLALGVPSGLGVPILGVWGAKPDLY